MAEYVGELNSRISKLELSLSKLQDAPSTARSDNKNALAVVSLDDESAAAEVKIIVSALRRDLGSQRKMLDELYGKLQPIVNDFQVVRDDLAQLKSHNGDYVTAHRFAEVCADLKLELKTSSVAVAAAGVHAGNGGVTGLQALGNMFNQAVGNSPKAPQLGVGGSGGNLEEMRQRLSQDFVSMSKFNETISELRKSVKQECSNLHDILEHTALKAGYLAVTASECSPDEKTLLFDTLKAKEQDLTGKTSARSRSPSPAPSRQAMSSLKTAVGDLMKLNPPQQTLPMASGRDYLTNGSIRDIDGEFNIRLPRAPGTKLGLSLDGNDGNYLLVERVGEGLVKQWNLANPTQALNPGDRIVSVNGVRGSPAVLIEETAKESSPLLNIIAMRGSQLALTSASSGGRVQAPAPQEFMVKLLCMKGEKLGMSLDCDDGATLVITKINAGLMQSWNDAHPAMCIKTGDRIVTANGKRGDPKVLLEQTQLGGELSLGIVRT